MQAVAGGPVRRFCRLLRFFTVFFVLYVLYILEIIYVCFIHNKFLFVLMWITIDTLRQVSSRAY